MSDVRYNEIGLDEEGQRLDNYLIRILKGVPRSHIYRIIRAGEVRINKKRADASTRLQFRDLVRIPPVRVSAEKGITVGQAFQQRLRDCILFEDEGLVVVNKPAGVAVHGGSGLSLGMIEALRKTRSDLAYLELVHRLDKDTSGCLLFAKKRSILRAIQQAFAEREVSKIYWVLMANRWEGPKKQLVTEPLLKNTLKSGERFVVVSASGKPSETGFRLLENYREACWVEATPKTGRTHQIRVHAAFMGHPVVGDPKYGKQEQVADTEKNRLYLHARAIAFNLNGVNHRFEADPDDCFTQSLKQLRSKMV